MSPREMVNRKRIEAFLEALGRRFPRPGTIFLVGGTTMVFEGFREQTLDIDITFEVSNQDHALFIQTVRELKEDLSLNIEEASPGHFIPLPPGYRDRCRFIGRYGLLDVFHFDIYSTALSKIERGTEEDLSDVLALLQGGWITLEELDGHFYEILPYVAKESLRQDPDEFQRKFQVLKEMWEEKKERSLQ